MTVKKGGLGRNLSALLSHTDLSILKAETKTVPQIIAQQLKLEQLEPGKYQPRLDMDPASLEELAQSIKQQGLLQPLVVRKKKASDKFEIIAGERRWRASKIAGLTEIPVIIKDVNDETAMAMALVENLQREDLNPMDQARAMERLTEEFALTHQQVADLLAKSRAQVSNYLRLLNLDDTVKKHLEHGDLDMGHARALLSLESSKQLEVAQIIISKQLSVRETERLVEQVKLNKPTNPKIKTLLPISDDIQNRIHHVGRQINTAIKIKQGKDNKGQLVIYYQDEGMINSILSKLEA
jgi:ParB family chromosome partitioning protein